MTYRLRNLRTGETLSDEQAESFPADEAAEWILEFDADDNGSWLSSSFHLRTINGVEDPRALAELREILASTR